MIRVVANPTLVARETAPAHDEGDGAPRKAGRHAAHTFGRVVGAAHRAGGRRRRRASTPSGNCTRPSAAKSWSLTAAATRTATRAPSTCLRVCRASRPGESHRGDGALRRVFEGVQQSPQCGPEQLPPETGTSRTTGSATIATTSAAPSAPVASVTWGAARRFTLKPRKKMPASLEADA